MAMDVRRCLAHWDIHRHIKITKRIQRRRSLLALLDSVSKRLSHFRYYQGLHEVCLVVLEVCQDDLNIATEYSVALLELGFYDLIHRDFQDSVLPLLELVGELIYSVDPALAECILRTGCEYHFVLPWILTWFAHSLEKFENICRIYSVMIEASDSGRGILICYLCAAVIIGDRSRILARPDDSNYTMAVLQTSVRAVDIDDAVRTAFDLLSRYPPDKNTLLRRTRSRRRNSADTKKRLSWRLGVLIVGVGAMTASVLLTYRGQLQALISNFS